MNINGHDIGVCSWSLQVSSVPELKRLLLLQGQAADGLEEEPVAEQGAEGGRQ